VNRCCRKTSADYKFIRLSPLRNDRMLYHVALRPQRISYTSMPRSFPPPFYTSFISHENVSSSSSSSCRTISHILFSCARSPAMLIFNFRNNQMARGYLVFYFLGFCQLVIIYPVCMISSCSSPDSDRSYDILDVSDVADVFVTNFIPQSIAIDAP